MADSVALLLMGRKGLAALSGTEGHAIAYAVIGRDPGQEDLADELFATCAARGIPALERNAPRPHASHLICAAWRWLERDTTATVITLHDSLLPRLRGWNPLVTALINGDREIGVTAILADGEADHGPILGQVRIGISYPLRIADAISALLPAYASLTADALSRISRDELHGAPQDEVQATYSLWRDEQDYAIDWSWSAERIVRFIDATGAPYLGASTCMQDRRIRILSAESLPDLTIENRCPGKLMAWRNGRPVVVCGSGLLRIIDARDDEHRPVGWTENRIRLRFGECRLHTVR